MIVNETKNPIIPYTSNTELNIKLILYVTVWHIQRAEPIPYSPFYKPKHNKIRIGPYKQSNDLIYDNTINDKPLH